MGKKKYIFEELVGKKVNFLTPESISEKDNKWNFRCDCGEIITKFPTLVYTGKQMSCGCKKRELLESKRKDIVIKQRESDARSAIGQKFGKLEIIGFEPILPRERTKMICKCSCGKTKSILFNSLKFGGTRSCGCLHKETVKKPFPTIHGYSNSYLYTKWKSIKQRCYDVNADNYKRYGGRGIVVCEEWLNSPKNFIEWAEENGGLNRELTIDRIDPNGPYSPDNCRFITIKEQNKNKRGTIMLSFNGETKPLIDFSEEFGMNPRVVRARLKHGWTVEEALTTPVRKQNN